MPDGHRHAPHADAVDRQPGAVVRAVTVIMVTVVGLTFLFGFGNVLNLAPHDATTAQLRPARRLLIFASLATLARPQPRTIRADFP